MSYQFGSFSLPHFIELCFIVLQRQCIFFYTLKICGNPVSSKSTGTHFLTAYAHFVSLCHILVILTIFQTFSLSLQLTLEQQGG